MTIGLPKAFLYYRYQYLWDTFFRELGCDVITSCDTNQSIISSGIKDSIDENCLPLKIYMGHVRSLIGKCNYILVPRIVDFGKNDEMCVRFLGLYDLIRNTYGDVNIISYNLELKKNKSELNGFMKMGKFLGFKIQQVYLAYHTAKQKQECYDNIQLNGQNELYKKPGLKILISAQPYLIHDPFIGGPVIKMIRQQGGVPLYSDRCDRQLCKTRSKEISASLYWTMNKEAIGAIALNKERVDGVILLTAFPCGTDSLVNELVLRKIKEVPIIQILLDEQQGETGLQTRIESFMDILQQREFFHVQ